MFYGNRVWDNRKPLLVQGILLVVNRYIGQAFFVSIRACD